MDRMAILAVFFVIDLFWLSAVDGAASDFMFMGLPRVFFRLNKHLLGLKLR